MCGRFETNPTAEALITALKKHKVDLILDLETKKRIRSKYCSN